MNKKNKLHKVEEYVKRKPLADRMNTSTHYICQAKSRKSLTEGFEDSLNVALKAIIKELQKIVGK